MGSVSKLRYHVSFFDTASLLTPLLVSHLLCYSWAGDSDPISTSYTLTFPRESGRDSWLRRGVMIHIVDSENCPQVKQSGYQMVVHGFLGPSLKFLVSRDSRGWTCGRPAHRPCQTPYCTARRGPVPAICRASPPGPRPA